MKKETLLLRMPEEVKKKLKEEAEKQGVTMNGLIMNIIREYLQQQSS